MHNGLFICSPNQKIDYLNTTIKKISKEQDLYFIDVNSCFRTPEMSFKNEYSLLMNSANSNADDGVHPTIKGYLIIGRHIASELKELRLVKRKMKIICFGDSITFGAFMEGKGTALGDTYPAVLLEALKRRR